MAYEVIRKTAGKCARAASFDTGFTQAGFTWEAAKARLASLPSGGIRPSPPVGAILAHVKMAREAGGDPEQPSAPPESPPTAPVELPPEPSPEPPATPAPEIPVAPPVEAPDIPPPEIPADTSQGMTETSA